MKPLVLLLIIHLGLTACNSACAQWVQTNGPNGGAAVAFAVQGTDLFVGTMDGGLFRSSNHGGSWTPSRTWLGCDRVGPMISKDSSLFVSVYGVGLYRSTDGGETWTLLNSEPMLASVIAFAVSQARLFVAAGKNVHVSDDHGDSWQVVGDTLSEYGYAMCTVGENLFVGGDDGTVFILRNGESKWQSSEVMSSSITSMVLNGTTLFAGSRGGVLRSTDSGRSWSTIPAGAAQSLTVCNGVVWAANDSSVIRSSDNGTSWSPVRDGMTPLTFENPYVLALIAMDTVVFAATKAGGVYKIGANEESWKAVNHGFTATDVYPLKKDDAGLWASATGVGFHSNDNGETWSELNWPPVILEYAKQPILCFANHDGTLYAAGFIMGLWASTNGGYDWQRRRNGLPDSFTKYEAWIAAIASVQSDVIIGTANGVYRSSDNGANWTVSNGELLSETAVLCFATQGSDLFAGTEFGVFHSTDNGLSWNARNAGIERCSVRTIVFGPSHVFIGAPDSGVFRSSDRGLSWERIRKRGSWPADLAFTSNCLIATSNDGVIMSGNNGTSWTPINQGLYCAAVESLESDGDDLFISVRSGGVWRRSISEILRTVDVETDEVTINDLSPPSSFSVLSRPFTNDLYLTFDATQSGPTTIDLYDVRGGHIASWHSDHIEAGSQNVSWTLQELVKGLYFVRLTNGQQSQFASVLIQQ